MKPIQSASRQKGVTLIESLLGILLFSVGILAVVGLQTVAVKTVAESKYRTDASFLANEIIGEMWANKSNVASYAYTSGTPPAVLSAWVTKVNNTLPGTVANPPTIAVAGNAVTVTVFWQHPEEAKQTPPPPPHLHRVVASVGCC